MFRKLFWMEMEFGLKLMLLFSTWILLSACGAAKTAEPQEISTKTEIAGETERYSKQESQQESVFSSASGDSEAPPLTSFVYPRIGVEEYPKVDGSTATLPLSQGLYRLTTGAAKEEAESAVSHTKTTNAYLSLLEGTVDLVIAYEPGPSVQEKLKECDEKLKMKPVGKDALVFMANASNPVNSLTQKQIRDIYSGNMTNWSEAGGADEKIEAFQRPQNSGSQTLMEKLVMKETPLGNAPEEYVISEMEGLLAQVASYHNTSNALGYSVYFYASTMARQPELKFMAVDGVAPSNSTIRDGSYPYVNEFYVAVREGEPENSRAYELFSWLTTADGQAFAEGLGYVGVSESDKRLPEEWKRQNSVENGTGAFVELDEDEWILASGFYLYGKTGTAVFDGNMRLVRFLDQLNCDGLESFGRYRKDAVLIMNDTRVGRKGLYSLKDGSWLIEPEYDNIFAHDGGFRMIQYAEGSWDSGIYAVADGGGAVLEKRELRREDPVSQFDGALYEKAANFAANHPELLRKYGVQDSDVDVFYVDLDTPFIVIYDGSIQRYFDVDGNWLLDFDMGQGRYDSCYCMVLDGGLAYVCAWAGDRETIFIYEDGRLIKTLNEGGYLRTVDKYFYARENGNYVTVYNYDDEAVASFLLGWYAND